MSEKTTENGGGNIKDQKGLLSDSKLDAATIEECLATIRDLAREMLSRAPTDKCEDCGLFHGHWYNLRSKDRQGESMFIAFGNGTKAHELREACESTDGLLPEDIIKLAEHLLKEPRDGHAKTQDN